MDGIFLISAKVNVQINKAKKNKTISVFNVKCTHYIKIQHISFKSGEKLERFSQTFEKLDYRTASHVFHFKMCS